MSIFKGNCPAIITPFSKDGKKINFESFKKLVDFQIKGGVSAIVFLGTTGESATLSEDEKIKVCNFAVKYVNGRVPVILGCGTNNTQTSIKLAKTFEKLGANGLLCVTPYYNKCTQTGLIQHYREIAKSTSLPIILYNVPGRTGVNIEPATVRKLSEINNIVGLKEASGNMAQIVDVMSLCGDKIDVYSGDDNITLPILSMGGKGVISVLSNIAPKSVTELCENAFNGNYIKAREIQIKHNKLIKSLFSEVNPIPVKTALNIMGYNVGPVRLPLSTMQRKKKNALKKNLEILDD